MYSLRVASPTNEVVLLRNTLDRVQCETVWTKKVVRAVLVLVGVF